MPVGHAVTATMTVLPSAGAAAAAAGAGSSAGGLIALFTRVTISSALCALRSPSVNSERIRLRASSASSARCASSEPSEAAIRKAMSAGPSKAPKSTDGFNRAKASELVFTAAERQCGMAMPPPSPVAAFSSRARASASRPAASARPVLATSSARL